MNIKLGWNLLFLSNMFNLFNSQCPVGKPASNVTDCTSYNNSTQPSQFCCMLTAISGSTSQVCYGFNNTIPSTQQWGVINYNVNCGTNSTILPAASNSTSNNPQNPTSPILPANSTLTPGYTLPSYTVPSQSSLYGIGYSNCGKPKPSSIADCSIESTEKRSCCFYNYQGVTGCFWYDSSTPLTNLAFNLTCPGSMIRISLVIYLLSIVINLLF